MEKRYRLYIDESGDHTFKLAESDNHRYLGLLGIWFDVEGSYRSFAQALASLRRTCSVGTLMIRRSACTGRTSSSAGRSSAGYGTLS